MKKKKYNKHALVPIPFIMLFVILNIAINDLNPTINFIFTFIFITLFIVVFGLIISEGTYRGKGFDLKKVKNLDRDIYGYYAAITKEFSFKYVPQTEYPVFVSENDRLRIEHFIVVLVKHPQFLHLFKHKFETMKHSDGKYFQLMHIYALYYLLENDITKFSAHYREYKSRIHLRTESRVLNEKLNRITFGSDYYEIPLELIELLYEYYVLDRGIDHEILKFRPKSKLDEMIYMTVLYHYLEASENHKLMADIEEEYMKFQQIRKNL